MKFPVLPVRSAKDATLNFEQLQKFVTEQEEKVKALEAGAWTNPESFNAKLEETATCQVRVEQGKTSVRLKGFVKAKEEIAANGILFTLPTGFRPKEVVRFDAAELTVLAVQLVYINTNGTVEVREPLKAGRFVSFDTKTFNLT